MGTGYQEWDLDEQLRRVKAQIIKYGGPTAPARIGFEGGASRVARMEAIVEKIRIRDMLDNKEKAERKVFDLKILQLFNRIEAPISKNVQRLPVVIPVVPSPTTVISAPKITTEPPIEPATTKPKSLLLILGVVGLVGVTLLFRKSIKKVL